jgi:hypothetical protein
MQKQSTSTSATMIWDEDGLKELIGEWMKEDKRLEKESREAVANGTVNKSIATSPTSASSPSPFPRILGFSREDESREVLVELLNPLSGKYELPLAKFGLTLADILEDTLTSTALCFVADASSGLGSEMVADILDASKAGVVRNIFVWLSCF